MADPGAPAAEVSDTQMRLMELELAKLDLECDALRDQVKRARRDSSLWYRWWAFVSPLLAVATPVIAIVTLRSSIQAARIATQTSEFGGRVSALWDAKKSFGERRAALRQLASYWDTPSLHRRLRMELLDIYVHDTSTVLRDAVLEEMIGHVDKDTLLAEFANANREAVRQLSRALQNPSGTAPAIAVYQTAFDGLQQVADSATYIIATQVAATGTALARTLASRREWQHVDLSRTMLSVPLVYLGADRQSRGLGTIGDARIDTKLRLVASNLTGMTITAMQVPDSLEFVDTRLDSLRLAGTELGCVLLRGSSSMTTANGEITATILVRTAGGAENQGVVYPRPNIAPVITRCSQ
jgi:hypothetical protein